MMIKKIFKHLLLLLFICAANNMLNAQVKDAGLWIGLNVEKEINKKIDLNFTEEFRLNENMSELGSFFSEIGGTYKINKLFRISAKYRFSNRRNIDDSYSIRHRVNVDFTLRKKIDPLTISLRERFHVQYVDMFCSEDGLTPEMYARTRLKVKYEINKKLSPYFYSEIFIPVNDKDKIGVDNVRASLGIEYEINKKNAVDAFYLFQTERLVNVPEQDYIAGIGYTFKF